MWGRGLGLCALELEVKNPRWGFKELGLWMDPGLGTLAPHPWVAHHTPPPPTVLPRAPQGEAGEPGHHLVERVLEHPCATAEPCVEVRGHLPQEGNFAGGQGGVP